MAQDTEHRTSGRPEGRRVLAIVTNYGVEQDELVVPLEHLRGEGVQVDVAATSADDVQTLVGDKDPGRTVTPNLTLADADPAGYDLLLVPGGTINADALRLQDDAVSLVRAFTAAGKPVAAICHGPWALVEAAAVEGKTLTSYASLETDVLNAGGAWVDRSVVRDDEGYTLVTSRDPGDLDDRTVETVERHRERARDAHSASSRCSRRAEAGSAPTSAIASMRRRRPRAASGCAAIHATASRHSLALLRASMASSGCPKASERRALTSTTTRSRSRTATMSSSTCGHRQLRSWMR